jgi:uncharacterized repeat protein (TIGR01451 family)
MGNGSGLGTVRRRHRPTVAFLGLLVAFSFVLGQAAYAAGPKLTTDPGAGRIAPAADPVARQVAPAAAPAVAGPLDEGGVTLDFIAAGPYTYDHATGVGGAFGDRTISTSTGVVESLEGGDFACGDRVVFFTALTVDPDAGSGSVELDFTYDGQTTSGAKVGFDDLRSASVNVGDTGNAHLDGNESVTVNAEQWITTGKDRLETSIQVDGVDGGDQIVLRMVVELYCDPNPGNVTGNIQSTLDAARVVHGTSINSGEQTIPLKQAGDILLPGLSVQKSCPASGTVGDTIAYEITVSNTGEDALTDLVVHDPLLGGNLSGFGTSLAAGAEVTRTFTYTLGADPDPVVNTVTATATGPSSGAQVSDVADCTTDVRFPDLAIVKTADLATVSAGDDIGYTIAVTNGGAGVARDVVLTDVLPADDGLAWEIDGGTGATECAIEDGVLTCSFGDLRSGAEVTVHLSSPTTAETCGTVRNSVAVTSSNDGDPEAGPVDIVVNCPNIAIEKTADAEVVAAADQVGFTITVTNAGPGIARDVVVTDTLPTNAGLGWSIDGGSGAERCEIVEGVLTCTFGDMGAGATATVHISSDTDATTCGLIDNTAVVTIANGDGDQDDAQVSVECPELGIDIQKDGPDLAHVGDTVTYTFEVTSTTDEPLYDVVVGDANCDAGAPAYVAGDDEDFVLEPGEVWTYTCDHVVTDEDADPLPNTATVTGTSDDARDVSDQDDHLIDLIHPDIRIVKSVTPDGGQPGDIVTYRYEVTNTGDTTLYDLQVDDDVIGRIGDIDALEPGETVTLTKDWELPSEGIDVINIGTATGTDVLGEEVSDDDDAFVTVVLPATPPPTAFTGGDTWRLGTLAGMLLLVGLTAVGLGRRRRPRTV